MFPILQVNNHFLLLIDVVTQIGGKINVVFASNLINRATLCHFDVGSVSQTM